MLNHSQHKIHITIRYMSQVDKALKAFEYTTEWADLIAALGKLNGVLLKHMKYPIIPRRIVISKVSFGTHILSLSLRMTHRTVVNSSFRD